MWLSNQMQKKQTYLIFLLAVLLYPAVYQFLHIFPHQQHSGHTECHNCVVHHSADNKEIEQKHEHTMCHVYDFQYSVNEFISLTALLPYRGEIIAKFNTALNSVLQGSSIRLTSSRAPPFYVV